MSIEFLCSGCRRRLRTGDETAGKQARCPECGAIMFVPGTSPCCLLGLPFGIWALVVLSDIHVRAAFRS
jgi:DNA-directed RNA polymerase subunit RPC12/RpoP